MRPPSDRPDLPNRPDRPDGSDRPKRPHRPGRPIRSDRPGWPDLPDWPPLSSGINLVGLGLLTYGVASFPSVYRHAAAIAVLAVAAAAWLAWLALLNGWLPAAALPPVAATMALGGAVLTPLAALAIVFPGVATMALTVARPFRRSAWVMALAPAAMFVATAAMHRPYGPAIGGMAAVFAASVMGISRRESQERVAQAAAVDVASARAEAEAARAELLAGRNHLARELHDVLAHTLSALSLHLEGLDALLDSSSPGDRPPAVADQLDLIKRLVREGLDEARGAVAALREDLPPLNERLAKLAAERRAAMLVTGCPRDLAPDVSLALYRVAQEALTNVAKHAPGAPARVELGFEDKEVTLAVANPSSPQRPAPIARTGGGYGLQGIKERILLIGGRVEAGPEAGGWRVEARVPA